MKSRDVNSDRAYEHIRRRILSGEYASGQHLQAKRLAAAIKLSPTPVRDALRQLESDGLVTIRPRLGAQVNTMGLKEFCELCELRLVLETHTAGLAAKRRSDGELREIELALTEMRSVTAAILAGSDKEEPGRMGELARVDIQFHIAIMTAAKNELIRSEILRLHLINRVVSGPMPLPGGRSVAGVASAKNRAERHAHLRQVLAEHEAIFDAIKRQDAAAARNAMERSLQDVIDQTIQSRAREERELMARELTAEVMSGGA
jgi:DNA-binding GntR family transcriptional regulator